MKANGREITTYSDSASNRNFRFGEYILFVEYTDFNSETQTFKTVSKPKLAIILNEFMADMAFGFDYVEWVNFNRYSEEPPKIKSHIEWSDVIDVIGRWDNRPSLKEILKYYRKSDTERIDYTKALKINNNNHIHNENITGFGDSNFVYNSYNTGLGGVAFGYNYTFDNEIGENNTCFGNKIDNII